MPLSMDPNHVFRDGPSGSPYEPLKWEIRRLLNEFRQALIALIAGQGGDIELPNLLISYSVIGGTENAIIAEADLPVPAGAGVALFSIGVAQTNTGAVTVNGKPLLTNSGGQIAAGGLVADGIYLFLDDGANYRLLSDYASAAIVAAAEAAQAAAEASAARAEGFAAMLSVDKIKFNTVQMLLSDTTMSYAPGPNIVEVGEGDVIEAQGHRYEVALSAAADAWLIETEGGVKLSSIDDSPPPEAFGAAGNGSIDDTEALGKWVAYHVAKGLKILNMRPRLYLVDGLIVPDDVILFANGATLMRRVNRAFPLTQIGKRSICHDLIANGRADILGYSPGGSRMTGIVLDDYAQAYNCEAYKNARHGIANRNVADQLQYVGIGIYDCYAHDNGLPHPTDPPNVGTGTGDDFNMTNCADWVARDCRSHGAARNGFSVTSFDTNTGEPNPALTGWGLIDNLKVSGSGYIDLDIEIAPKCRVVTFDNPGAEISCRGSADVTIRDARCGGITGVNVAAHGGAPADRVKIYNAEIENSARSNQLLELQGADIVAINIRCKSTAAPNGNMVNLRASNRRGTARDIHVDGALNGIVLDVDNIGGLSGDNVSGTQVRYGPADASINLNFSAGLQVNRGISRHVAAATPTSGTFAQHSRVDCPFSAGQPSFRICTNGGSPGNWSPGPNY